MIVALLGACGSIQPEIATSTFITDDGREIPIIKLGNLEVMTEDLGRMNWDNAMKACADLEGGWRLPTKDEMNLLYEHYADIQVWTYGDYWASTEESSGILKDKDMAWFENFHPISGGYGQYSMKSRYKHVRAVRTSN